MLLALESTGARMNRLGSEVLAESPLLSLGGGRRARSSGDGRATSWARRRAVAARAPLVAGIGPDEARFDEALDGVLGARRGMIRVAVAGAAGRMGQTDCAAVEVRPTWSSSPAPTRRSESALARPSPREPGCARRLHDPEHRRCERHGGGCGGRPRRRSGRPALTSSELRGLAGANVFVAPNFAIGAVLMMQFAAQAARHMAARRDHRAAPRPQARRARAARPRGPPR